MKFSKIKSEKKTLRPSKKKKKKLAVVLIEAVIHPSKWMRDGKED